MWLIKFCDNWSDEMDMEGFTILSHSDYTEYRSLLCDTAKKKIIKKKIQLISIRGTQLKQC